MQIKKTPVQKVVVKRGKIRPAEPSLDNQPHKLFLTQKSMSEHPLKKMMRFVLLAAGLSLTMANQLDTVMDVRLRPRVLVLPWLERGGAQ